MPQNSCDRCRYQRHWASAPAFPAHQAIHAFLSRFLLSVSHLFYRCRNFSSKRKDVASQFLQQGSLTMIVYSVYKYLVCATEQLWPLPISAALSQCASFPSSSSTSGISPKISLLWATCFAVARISVSKERTSPANSFNKAHLNHDPGCKHLLYTTVVTCRPEFWPANRKLFFRKMLILYSRSTVTSHSWNCMWRIAWIQTYAYYLTGKFPCLWKKYGVILMLRSRFAVHGDTTKYTKIRFEVYGKHDVTVSLCHQSI